MRQDAGSGRVRIEVGGYYNASHRHEGLKSWLCWFVLFIINLDNYNVASSCRQNLPEADEQILTTRRLGQICLGQIPSSATARRRGRPAFIIKYNTALIGNDCVGAAAEPAGGHSDSELPPSLGRQGEGQKIPRFRTQYLNASGTPDYILA